MHESPRLGVRPDGKRGVMAEFVLGTGQRQTLRNVLRLTESVIVKTEGVPREIRLWNDWIRVNARRPEFKGDYENYRFRLPLDRESEIDALERVAEEYADLCEFTRDEDGAVLECPLPGQVFSPKVYEALNKISMALQLPEVWHAEGADFHLEPISVEMLFHAMVQYKASDLHLSPGLNPVFRIDNETRHSELLAPLSGYQINDLIRQIAPPGYWEEFEQYKQTSFSFHQAGVGYARVSAFVKSGAPHCTFRFLPEKIPSFDELNIPGEQMRTLAATHRGLILVTGMTGSGKTTTVAALLDWINTNRSVHILTIENPVEYVHNNKKSIVSQRNLGVDVGSFSEAITGALRHDPDVILIGEMRDPDTIRSAINAAATGHLVISTLHANTASEVTNRIVSFFDPNERDLVRLQLRDCLRCVMCQRLVQKPGGGRIPALEFLFNDIKPIADGILRGDTDQIRVGMQQTVSHSILFEQYLHRMYKENKIDLERGQEFATDQSVFDQLVMGTYAVPRLDSIKGG